MLRYCINPGSIWAILMSVKAMIREIKYERDVGLVDKYKENHSIIAVVMQFGYKRGNVPGLTLVREVPKTVF